jgi:hypothetical protein
MNQRSASNEFLSPRKTQENSKEKLSRVSEKKFRREKHFLKLGGAAASE